MEEKRVKKIPEKRLEKEARHKKNKLIRFRRYQMYTDLEGYEERRKEEKEKEEEGYDTCPKCGKKAYVGDDYASPDSGGMGGHCEACGYSWSHILY